MILSPSLLSSDFGNLESELSSLEKAGLTWVHWDVMDGMYVPNITFGPPIIKSLRKKSGLFFDTHLMIEAPERYIDIFADAGADLLTIHVEASKHLDRTLSAIRDAGMYAGVSLNPATSLSAIENVLEKLDLVLIMSVNPGFGGQGFIPRSIEKIRDLDEMLFKAGSQAVIEVDGGVDLANTAELMAAGANALVSGSAFFGHPPYAERFRVFKNAAANAEKTLRPVTVPLKK